jgi:coenzyme Q-binding protein COQ10
LPEFSKRQRVEHSAGKMFDLVADIERYPEFVPLCESLTVRSRRNKGKKTILVADMAVGYKSIKQKFTSQILLDREELVIDVKYIDGPFKRMDNQWRFFPISDSESEVEFYIDYEFRSRTLGLLMGAMFDQAFRRFTAAFEERANRIYA